MDKELQVAKGRSAMMQPIRIPGADGSSWRPPVREMWCEGCPAIYETQKAMQRAGRKRPKRLGITSRITTWRPSPGMDAHLWEYQCEAGHKTYQAGPLRPEKFLAQFPRENWPAWVRAQEPGGQP